MLTYKGFIGKMEIDENEGIIYGRVLNLSRDGITFAGKTVKDAEEDFHNAVDDYLAWAEEDGFEPEKPYRGEIIFRPGPTLHKQIALATSLLNVESINQFLKNIAEEKINNLFQSGVLSKETKEKSVLGY